MADKVATDRIPATDIGSAVRAKVERLKEAQSQIEQRTKEIEVERRRLDGDRRDLQRMEEALETLKSELDKRDDNLKSREERKDGVVPVPYEQLPVELPKVTTFTGRGDSPLAQVPESLARIPPGAKTPEAAAFAAVMFHITHL